MRISKVFGIGICLVITAQLPAQPQTSDTVFNQTDEQGQKQGFWKKEYENGKPVYIGYFKDGKPTGELKRFYENGEVKAIMNFKEESDTADATLYYQNGEKAAEGTYIGQKRHGEWRFYSYYDQTLKAIEHYNQGIKEDISKSFYSSGQVAQELKWQNDKENGAWKQYFESGLLKLQALFKDGNLHGDYMVYHPNGEKYVEGQYKNGLMEGDWIYYNEDGSVKAEITYQNGEPVKGQELLEQEQEFFEMIEENKGKYTEPTVEDVMSR